MKKLLALVVLISFLFISNSVNSQEIKFKSLYLYNFTKYIGWPPASKSGDFVIGVLGSNAIFNKLNEIAAGKMAGSQTIVVTKFGSPDELTKCHILFVGYGKSGGSNMATIMQKIGTNSTLLVTEREGTTKKGSAINFVIRNEQMKFELNKANALKQNLQISLNLEKLAILVE